MKRIISKIVMVVLISGFPLTVIKLLIKNPDDFIAQVKVNYQIMVFVIKLGRN